MTFCQQFFWIFPQALIAAVIGLLLSRIFAHLVRKSAEEIEIISVVGAMVSGCVNLMVLSTIATNNITSDVDVWSYCITSLIGQITVLFGPVLLISYEVGRWIFAHVCSRVDGYFGS